MRKFYHSEETKKKISKNNAKYWLGKKRPDISKFIHEREFIWGDRISKALKGKPSNMKGKKMTEESKQKMRLAKLGKKQSEETKLKRKVSTINYYRQNETYIEKILYNELRKRSIVFVRQHIIHGFIVDAYIPSLNLVIEADGDYWHSRNDMIKRDKIKNSVLLTNGFRLLRISETDFNNKSFVEKLDKELVC